MMEPSYFQIQYFVVGREPTAQAKMHRCLEEIKQRRNSIDNAKLEIEEQEDVIALCEIRMRNPDCPKVEEDVYKRRLQRKMDSTMKQIKDLRDRISVWSDEIGFLDKMYKDIAKKVELKDWNDYDVQLEYWNEKLGQEIRQRLLLNAPVDIELIKTVLALPDSAPVKKCLPVQKCINKGEL